MPRKNRPQPSMAMKSFFGNWLVEHGTPKPKKPRPSKEHFPTPPSSVASDASIAGMSDVSTIFQAPQTPSARSEASEQSDISQLSIAVPNIPQLDKDGFAVPTMKRGVNKSKRAGLQFPVARIKRLLKTGGYARRATTDASIYMTAVIEYLTAELLEVCGTIANEMGQKHIRARHLKLGLRNDAELGAAVRNSRNSRAQVPMIAVNNEDLPEPGDALRKGPASYSRPPSSASSSRKNSVQISTPSAAGKRQRNDSAQKSITDFFGSEPRPKKQRVCEEGTPRMRQSSIQNFFGVKRGKTNSMLPPTRRTRRSSLRAQQTPVPPAVPESPRLADLIRQTAALSSEPLCLGKARKNLRGIRAMRKGLAKGQRRSLGHTDSLFTPAVSGQRSAVPAASPGPPAAATPLPFRILQQAAPSPATRLLGNSKTALDLGVIKAWQPAKDPNAQLGYINRLKKRPQNVQEPSDGFCEGDENKENAEPTRMEVQARAGAFGMEAERNFLETPQKRDVYH